MVRSRLLRFSNSRVRLPSQRYICISMRGSRRTAKSLKEYSAIISLSYRVHFLSVLVCCTSRFAPGFHHVLIQPGRIKMLSIFTLIWELFSSSSSVTKNYFLICLFCLIEIVACLKNFLTTNLSKPVGCY